jgi:uncharacterized membrane protein YcaP (DUF421 family)
VLTAQILSERSARVQPPGARTCQDDGRAPEVDVESVAEDLVKLAIPWWSLVLRCVVIYVVMVVGLRLFGKREVGQFRLSDLVLVLLVANAVQPAMTGPDTSLAGGVIIIATLLAVNKVWNVVWLKLGLRSPRVTALLQGHPTVLVEDGQWLDAALEHEGVDRDEVAMAFREHGMEDVKDVKLAVMELDGSISVVPKDSPMLRTRRRVRTVHRG